MKAMKEIKDLSLSEMNAFFRSATTAAKEEADKRGLPKVGFDEDGKLVEHPDGEPRYNEQKYKGRNVA